MPPKPCEESSFLFLQRVRGRTCSCHHQFYSHLKSHSLRGGCFRYIAGAYKSEVNNINNKSPTQVELLTCWHCQAVVMVSEQLTKIGGFLITEVIPFSTVMVHSICTLLHEDGEVSC